MIEVPLQYKKQKNSLQTMAAYEKIQDKSHSMFDRKLRGQTVVDKSDYSNWRYGLPDEDDCFTADDLSEVKNLTSRFQDSLSLLVMLNGHKIQVKCTTPEGWINLNLKLTKEIPVEFLNKEIPYQTISIPEVKEEFKITLTYVLWAKTLFKNVKIKSKDEDNKKCIETMLGEFKNISTKIIAKYPMMTKGFLCLYRDLVNTVEHLKTSFISNKWSAEFPDNVIQTTEEELLCDILGFGPELVRALQRLDDYDKNHQNVSYYIQKWVNSYLCGHPDIFKGIKTYVRGAKLEKALEALTFSTEMAGIIEPSIDADIQRTQSVKYWVFKYISHVIASHTLLCKEASVCYQPDRRDWFKETIDRHKRYEPKTNPVLQKTILMINVSEHSEFKDVDIKRHCKPGMKLWYHGTNTFDAADSILKQGIKLPVGEEMQDFSDRHGFYVTDSFKAARKYAERCSTNGYAIVVFESNIDSTHWKVLDLENDYETWRQVIRYHRSGRKKEINTIQILVDEMDCIKGSICSNIEKILDDNTTDIPMYLIDHVFVQQLCVKQISLAKHFGSLGNICAVIWFPGLTNDQESLTNIPKLDLMKEEESTLPKVVFGLTNDQESLTNIPKLGLRKEEESTLHTFVSEHLKEQYDLEDSLDSCVDMRYRECGPNVKCKKKDLSDIFLCTHEIQVSEGGEADLHKHLVACKKNPGHKQFVPVSDFNINHLPKGYHDNLLVEYINAVAGLTVRVAVKMTSTERPDFWPNTKQPYPFYNMRGSDVMRVGTGMVSFVNFEDKGTCPCNKSQHSDTASKMWGKVWVNTARQVVFDDLEARHTTCRLFFDRQNSPLVILDSVTVKWEKNLEDDGRVLNCVTCEMDLLYKLDKMLKHWRDLWMKVTKKYKRSGDKLTLIVSHPHGCSKQISLGHCIDKYKVSDTRTKYKYTTCTCPGSIGAYVHPLGYGGCWSYDLHVHCGVNFDGINVSCAGLDCGQFDF